MHNLENSAARGGPDRSLQYAGPMPAEASRATRVDHDAFGRLAEAIESDIRSGTYFGASMLVAVSGEIVFRRQFGVADSETGQPVDGDTVFATASMFKQLTNAVILQKVDRGQLAFTTRVAEIIPEYGTRGKASTTLADLLQHTAGLPFSLPELTVEDMGSIARMTDHACSLAPLCVPGSEVRYSGQLAHSVMAEMVRRVDGARRFSAIIAEDLLAPLGMRDTTLGGRKDLLARMAPQRWSDLSPGLNDPAALAARQRAWDIEGYEMPAGMGLSTPYDFFLFAEACRNGGLGREGRVMSPAMLRRATQISTGDMPNLMWAYAQIDHGWPEIPANLSLGFFVRGSGLFVHPFGSLCSPSTYGGWGAGSNCFWVDPEREIVSVFFSAGLIEETKSVMRHQRYSDLVQSAVL